MFSVWTSSFPVVPMCLIFVGGSAVRCHQYQGIASAGFFYHTQKKKVFTFYLNISFYLLG